MYWYFLLISMSDIVWYHPLISMSDIVSITLWSLWVILSVSPFDLNEWYCQYHPLISMSDIVSINKLTLILKNISQYDVTIWCLIPIKKITSVLKVSCITAHPIELAQILVIMSVSSSKLLLFYIIFFRQEWMELKDHVLTN
jgi:hypothetical protein